MLTNEDQTLSNISYCSKDFASVYTDLLDLAKKLTNVWDPSTSNESDPGVVLLKEAAFVSDHLNYNIDKNILEAFLPSATQESSIRDILEVNGYNPRYYISGEGTLTFSYTGDAELFSTIPAFSITVSNEAGDIVYTQCEALPVSAKNVDVSCKFIEGTCVTMNTPGGTSSETTIKLVNLDANNRLYFPTKYVAQNGVYVYDSNNQLQTDWFITDFLLTKPLGTKAFKIGYDSREELPYIEFPSDISSLIGDGLVIKYIQTSGAAGNVKANVLTKISSISNSNYTADDFNLSNLTAINNGKDPETNEEMYRSMIKTVGTFDTLVTRKDYENAVNMYETSAGDKYVSNSAVTDRTNDYNKALNVVSFGQYGRYTENVSLCNKISKITFKTSEPASNKQVGDAWLEDGVLHIWDGSADIVLSSASVGIGEFNALTDAMTPYDLAIHALKSYDGTLFTVLSPDYAAANSFVGVDDNTLLKIESALTEDNKTISHVFNNDVAGNVICFENYVKPLVTIIPYNKVNAEERYEIIENVIKALSDSFNASKVEFGYELNYEDVQSIIVNADSRIKSCRLEDLEYNYKVLKKTSNGSSVSDVSKDDMKDLIAKNVLAGKVCLFDIDNSISYAYGQTAAAVVSNVATIESEVTIPQGVTSASSAVTEYVERITITNQVSFSAGATSVQIPKNQQYTLQAADILLIGSTSYKNEGSKRYAIKNTGADTVTITTSPTSVTGELIMTVENDILLADPTYAYTLKKNETVIIDYDTYVDSVIYPQYTNYSWQPSDSSRSIPKGIDYKITGTDKLYLNYTSNGEEHNIILQSGSIINSTFVINKTETSRISKSVQEGDQIVTLLFSSITSGNTITEKTKKSYKLSSPSVDCIWIVGDSDNALFRAGDSERLLNADEYFIYKSGSDYAVLGVGTKLELATAASEAWVVTKPTIEQIYKGLGTYKTVSFANNNMTITDTTFLTLGEGSSFRIYDSTMSGAITNQWSTTTGPISYTLNDSETLLSSGTYKIRSKLLVKTSKVEPQTLLTNQSITLKDSSGTQIGESLSNKTILSDVTLNSTGSDSITVLGTAKIKYYTDVNPKKGDDDMNESEEYILSGAGTYVFKIAAAPSKLIIPMYIYGNNNNTVSVAVTGYTLKEFFTGSDASPTNGIHAFKLNSQSTESTDLTLTITISGSEPSVRLLPPLVHNGLNTGLSVVFNGTAITLEDIRSRMKTLIDKSTNPDLMPYLTEAPDNSIAIQDPNFKNPSVMWDPNNVANAITIPRIDLSYKDLVNDVEIGIHKSMRDYK